MVGQSIALLPLRGKVMTRNGKHLDPCPTSPHLDRKRKAKCKKRFHLSNKLKTTKWIAKAQGAAAASKSKDLNKNLASF